MKPLSFLGVRGFPLCLVVTRNVKEGESRDRPPPDDVLDAKSGANHYATAYQKSCNHKKAAPAMRKLLLSIITALEPQ
ncbi:hypothetical protein DX926_11650 [Bacillus atrophaeus]|nr:hypothetical protein DX926_11650 [Bacillus atrophaeus]